MPAVLFRAPFNTLNTLFPALLCGCAVFAAPLASACAQAPTAATAAAPSPAKTSDVQSASFVLQWIKPSQFVERLAFPGGPQQTTGETLLLPGLSRLSPDDTTGRVFIQGTPEAIAQLEQMTKLMDVNPRRVRLSVRILRAPANQFANFTEPGQKLQKGEVVSTSAAVFRNNETITLYALGDGLLFPTELTPHVFGDGSVAVFARFKETPEPRTLTRRVPNGAATLFFASPNQKNKNIAYYVEITPVVQQTP